MFGDDFPPRWLRELERRLREQEAMHRMLGPSESVRDLIEAVEMRRMLEPLGISSTSTAAFLASLDYEHILEIRIRADVFPEAGRKYAELREALTAGSYLAGMEDTRRTALLAHSFQPAIELDQALTKTYSADSHLAAFTTSRDNIRALQEAAAGIATFRTAIDVGIAQISVSPALQTVLDSLDQITSEATTIWRRIADNPDRFTLMPAALREVPVLQAFETSRSVALLFSDDEEIVEARPPQSLVSVRAASLPDKLRALHPRLAEKYEGVLHAVEMRGPDYIAQASASARELLKFTLELLAPEEAVLAREPTAKRGEDGKLTRRSLLEYVFGGIAASEDYAKMVEGQINLILASWFPLNTAVHNLNPDLAHEQLESLIIQVEFALIEMLHASDATGPT